MALKENLIEYGRIAFAEFIGTFILIHFGCMGFMTTLAGYEIGVFQVAWVFGICVMMAVETFAHVSGGHVNPTVTLTAVCAGHLHYLKFFLYFIAQTLGAIVGFALLKAVTPGTQFDLMTRDGNGALSVEFLISFCLGLVCCGVWDWRNADKMDSVPIKLGLTITGLAIAGAPWSGGSMNAARSFAPALINNNWDGHWIYWVGPFAGAIASGFLYRFCFAVPKAED